MLAAGRLFVLDRRRTVPHRRRRIAGLTWASTAAPPVADDEHVRTYCLGKVSAAACRPVYASPRLAVAYGGAFIGRGDFAVVGYLLSHSG